MTDNKLIKSVTEQLTKRCDAGALTNDELIRIMEFNQFQCSTSKNKLVAGGDDSLSPMQVPSSGVVMEDPVLSKPDEEMTQDSEPDTEIVDEKPLTPTEKAKKEISDRIIELGGTPPERGSLQKFKNALETEEALMTDSEEESTEEKVETEEEETKEPEIEEEDDIDRFNELMTELQELYDKLEEEEKIDDMGVVMDLMKEVNPDVEAPDELSYKELKQLHKALKKLDE